MSMISKERRDAIRVYIARSRSAGQTTGVFMVDDIGALLDALDAAEKAEPVAWMVRGHLRDGTAVLRLPVLTSREDADRYAACNPDYTLAPLYTHPAPAVREGWKPLTENVVGPVLVCRFGDEDHNWLPLTAHRVTGGKWERPASRDGLPYEPTHWQRLPTAAPEAK